MKELRAFQPGLLWTTINVPIAHCIATSTTAAPLAACLAAIVGHFEHLLSYDTIVLEVSMAEREIFQTTTAQCAIASYMGLVMAVSGCPNTIFLRPMARFHLPLASEDETIYRACSMYALAQFFIHHEKDEADYPF